jgi:hypothetical protein
MDIPNQFHKIRIFLAEYRFVPILEKFPVAPVAAVKGDSITREKSTHDSGYGMIAGLQKKMKVLCEAQNYVKLSFTIPQVSFIFRTGSVKYYT